jgi:hypothetical protein
VGTGKLTIGQRLWAYSGLLLLLLALLTGAALLGACQRSIRFDPLSLISN